MALSNQLLLKTDSIVYYNYCIVTKFLIVKKKVVGKDHFPKVKNLFVKIGQPNGNLVHIKITFQNRI